MNQHPFGNLEDSESSDPILRCQCMRTFLLIPLAVRSSPCFEAVYPNSVTLNYSHRTTEFRFTGVLSPDHEPYQRIIAPVLQAVEARRNALLALCCPIDSQDAAHALLSLCRNLLPQAFQRAGRECTRAFVSIFELRGTSIVDPITIRKLRRLEEVSEVEVIRAAAEIDWAAIMQQLHLRLGSPTAEESTFFVRITMENIAQLLVCDFGSSPSNLGAATLVLRSLDTDPGARTTAPRIPLTFLLEPFVPPRSLVHIVASPEPKNLSCTTRLLRFVSDFASFMERKEGIAVQSAKTVVALSSRRTPLTTAIDASVGASVSSIDSKTVSQALPMTTEPAASADSMHSPTLENWRNEFLVDTPYTALIRGGSQGRSTADANSSLAATFLRPTGASSPSDSRSAIKEGEGIATANRALHYKVSNLERVNTEVSHTLDVMEQELLRSRHANETLKNSLDIARQEADELNALLKLKDQQNADMSDLIKKLLARVEQLEDSSASANDVANALQREKNELSASLHEMQMRVQVEERDLKQQLSEARRAVKSLETKEAGRLRHSTLERIISPVSGRSHSAQHRDSFAIPQSGSAGAASSIGTTVALKQLRRRVDMLEKENGELKEQIKMEAASSRLTPSASGSRMKTDTSPPSSSLPAIISSLREQLALQAETTKQLQEEKAALETLLTATPASRRGPGGIDIAQAVSQSLQRGCELSSSKLRASRGASEPSIANAVFAVDKLKLALSKVIDRSGAPAVPSAAQPSDVDALAQILDFEAERLAHVKAFLPTYSQLMAAAASFLLRV